MPAAYSQGQSSIISGTSVGISSSAMHNHILQDEGRPGWWVETLPSPDRFRAIPALRSGAGVTGR